MSPYPLSTRYVGVLSLLAQSYRHVSDDLKDSILCALHDACEADPQLRVRRVIDDIEIEFDALAPAATVPGDER